VLPALSSGRALAAIAAVDELSDFVVLNKLATIGCGQAFLHFTKKPIIEVDQTLHSLQYQRFAVAPLVRCFLV